MFLNAFLFLIIYVTSGREAKDTQIPLCAGWNPNGTVIIGSKDGENGTNNTLLNQPTAIIAVGEDDTLYVVDSGNNRLMKYKYGSNIGKQVNINVEGYDGTLDNPQDITIDKSGGIYISEAGKNRVVRWTVDPPDIEIIMSKSIRSPRGIYLDEITDELYVVGLHNAGYGVVMFQNLSSSESEKVVGNQPPPVLYPPLPLSSLYAPVGIHVDREQRIYVAESDSHRITRWKAKKYEGVRVVGTGNCNSTISDICNPTSVILDDTDTMYIADMGNNRILRWSQNVSRRGCLLGCPKTIGNKTDYDYQLFKPYDIAFDSKLNFLVVEKEKHRIHRFHFEFDKACMEKNCQPPTISIKDYPPNQIRSQSIKFYINAELNCNIWKDTHMNCTVIACFPGDLSCIQTTKLNIIVNSFVSQKTNESFIMEIPPFGLPVGTYNFSCTITMTLVKKHKSTTNYSLTIVRSPTIITLLPLGKSKITLGYQQQYTFHPKISPDDIDQPSMRFVYYCRKYPNFNYTTIKGVRLNIDEDAQNPTNSTCFNLTALPQSFIYGNDTNQPSLTIMSRSLQLDQIYEFYVELYDDQGLVDKSDAVLVEIQSMDSCFVEILPIFDTFIHDDDYQLLNPSTQILLNSSSIDSCMNASIEWKIYTGMMENNSIIEWNEYNDTKEHSNQWFYGLNSSFLTGAKDLFSSNQDINYWQFVAIYTSNNEDVSGSGSVQLKINHPPVQQYCSIDPTDGDTSQPFTIICQNWSDLDGIKDYFLHVLLSSKSEIVMSIANSNEPVFSVYLPSGDPKSNYDLNLVVHVQDKLGAWTAANVTTSNVITSNVTASNVTAPSVTTIKVEPDEKFVNKIFNFKVFNFTEDLVFIGDQNQMINSFSTILNQMALDDQATLMNNSQVQISDLIISTFETIRAETSIGNDTDASMTFIKNLNRRSIIREYFLISYANISIPTTIEEIIILSSTINQLTNTTSEWTQKSLPIASTICKQLSEVLYNLSLQITFEQVLLAVKSLASCTSNIFTGVNGPLQHRGFIFDRDLDKDFFSPNEVKYDYIEYVDYELPDTDIPYCDHSGLTNNRVCKENIIDEDNSTKSILHDNRDLYQQKHLADEIQIEIQKTISFLAKSIRHHLNIFQNLAVISPVFRLFVEQIYEKDIKEKFIDLDTRNASIYFPKSLNFLQSNVLGIQAALLPLAPAGGDVGVNLSTALTLSVLDNYNNELKISATDDSPIEMFIPRDINLPIPMFNEENMTKFTPPRRGTLNINRQFFIYYINVTQANPSLTISIHFDLKPIQRNISYFIIYKFDQVPAYNSTHQSFNRSIMFCHEILTEEMDYYTFYIDNTQTAGYKSLFIGIRELGVNDKCLVDVLPQITDQPYGFLNNYFIRLYTSGCYYLSERGYWKSDGMKVGPETNFERTHCYSNHT